MLARIQLRICRLDRSSGIVSTFRQLLNIDYPMPGLEAKLNGIRKTRPVAWQNDTIHNNVDIVALLLVQLRQFIDREHRAVDADTGEALSLDFSESLLVPSLLALHDRSVEDDS